MKNFILNFLLKLLSFYSSLGKSEKIIFYSLTTILILVLIILSKKLILSFLLGTLLSTLLYYFIKPKI